jgi:hypothetical protein
VEDDRHQQDPARDPEAGAVQELPQEDGIPVDRGRALVELQVARHVGDDEAEENHARRRHHDLSADRRGDEAGRRRGHATFDYSVGRAPRLSK